MKMEQTECSEMLAYKNSDTGELPRRKHTTYTTLFWVHSWKIKDQLDVTCYFYFTSYVINVFQTLIYPSSGACDCVVEMGTTQTQLHQISNAQRTENKMTEVVFQQHSRKLLMMDILMSETCSVHKKWNKNSKWQQVRLLFLNYYNEAQSNKH